MTSTETVRSPTRRLIRSCVNGHHPRRRNSRGQSRRPLRRLGRHLQRLLHHSHNRRRRHSRSRSYNPRPGPNRHTQARLPSGHPPHLETRPSEPLSPPSCSRGLPGHGRRHPRRVRPTAFPRRSGETRALPNRRSRRRRYPTTRLVSSCSGVPSAGRRPRMRRAGRRASSASQSSIGLHRKTRIGRAPPGHPVRSPSPRRGQR